MKKIVYLFFISLLTIVCKAQNPADVAQNYGSNPGFNNFVNSIAVQSDGKILVGGTFTSFNGTTSNRIIRINTDGTKDTLFNADLGFNNDVHSIALQSDGKILVGGFFSSYNGTSENTIIRLNADGTKDASFNTGTGFNNRVIAIVVQTDGKILVGGWFSSYNGIATGNNRIIRLNTDGTKDTSFNTGTGFNSSVSTIALQNDGKIILGGAFTSFNGNVENRIIRLNANGTKDNTFITGTSFNNPVMTITVQTNGKILVGGAFTLFNGFTENRIIRLNTDGTKDTSFISANGFNEEVYSIALQADGKIVMGGWFTSYNETIENRIVRLNTDGTKDTSFNSGDGFDNEVKSIAIQNDGKILAGGSFTIYKETNENRVIRLNTDGTKDFTIAFNTETGFNDSVESTAVQSDGKIIVGGMFTTYNGIIENRIIRLNADGTKDNSFNTGIGFDDRVVAIVVQTDGKILVGGSFTSYNGAVENNIIRLNPDGTKDISFNTGTGFDGPVSSIVIQNDGKILVGGSWFTSYNGTTENRIIRLNADGTKDTSFVTGTGFNNIVMTIALQNDGKILVAGFFSSYNGTTENRIIRLNADGTKDNSFNIGGSGFVNAIYRVVVQNNGKILVGGGFTSFSGSPQNRIIRLNTDGSKDNTFDIGTGFVGHAVFSITIQNNEKILVGGGFTSYNEITNNKIIRLNTDGTIDTSFDSGIGFNNSIYSITLKTDGKIILGGGFDTYNGSSESANLITLYGDSIDLSTDSFSNSNTISLWPNPANEIINLTSLNNSLISNVKVYDLYGKLVLETSTNTIDISFLSSGMYILKVISEDGEITKKFIKE